jgi:hypothetical protein
MIFGLRAMRTVSRFRFTLATAFYPAYPQLDSLCAPTLGRSSLHSQPAPHNHGKNLNETPRTQSIPKPLILGVPGVLMNHKLLSCSDEDILAQKSEQD